MSASIAIPNSDLDFDNGTFDSAALRAGLTTPRGGSENGEYFD